ncbi:guanosine-3',5'-bis(diphosphate) 3'-pyrophosphohydrolase MESH1 [Elysia marginata]|uniref:Guanosine-3',5'-bis(diphosphate) 3'-pyrophosphohydrolase MESH1 n=1 Tax=Elysia marginata TaxID=1093978 RepID=A0AAV4H693_9GAST|nr:guanosine-3',5'-bis(diphosphate) 3'-pyrophosphohydrolase MESH1 [Elysia marginata]
MGIYNCEGVRQGFNLVKHKMAERNSSSQDEALSKVVKEIVRCTNFAALKHKDQRRKDKQQTPYVNHVIGVAHILVSEGGITDVSVIQAALLHDTVEDTDTSFYELQAEFGEDVARRHVVTVAAFTTLGRFWKTRDISLKTKLRIFNSNVKSVLLYGCEAWNASTMCIKRIQVFINRCLRRILRIKWTDKISNESLWKRTGQIPAGDEIGRRRWRWIGHTLRKPCGSITKNVLDWNPQGKRSRGRPRGTWRRVKDNDVKVSGHTWNHVKRMAQDRERWRGFVDGLYPAPG